MYRESRTLRSINVKRRARRVRKNDYINTSRQLVYSYSSIRICCPTFDFVFYQHLSTPNNYPGYSLKRPCSLCQSCFGSKFKTTNLSCSFGNSERETVLILNSKLADWPISVFLRPLRQKWSVLQITALLMLHSQSKWEKQSRDCRVETCFVFVVFIFNFQVHIWTQNNSKLWIFRENSKNKLILQILKALDFSGKI